MTSHKTEYKIIEGKTYSLFAGTNSPQGYYTTIAVIVDELLKHTNSISAALNLVRKESSRSGFIKSNISFPEKRNLLPDFEINRKPLYVYTTAAKKHLKNLPVLKFWDRRLSTTERQYHLYMIEIELTNRLNREAFKQSTWKIALLPYCLREFDHECKSLQGDFDVECRNCSKTCFIGRTSKLLRACKIEPYIWMGAGLKSIKPLAQQNRKIPAVLGIACIPELVAGMRRCRKIGLPVIGLPLNANRCIRWMGNFHENSVYIEKLEEIIQ